MYKKVLPQGNIMVQVSKCIAVSNVRSLGKAELRFSNEVGLYEVQNIKIIVKSLKLVICKLVVTFLPEVKLYMNIMVGKILMSK